MARKNLDARKVWGIARKMLACMASFALVVGLMPCMALADGSTRVFDGDQNCPIDVPNAEHTYNNAIVNGDIAAEGDDFYALYVSGKGESANADVNGSVSLETSEGNEVSAVFVGTEGYDGSQGSATTTISGDVSLEVNGEAISHSRASGVEVRLDGNSESAVTVSGNVAVSSDMNIIPDDDGTAQTLLNGVGITNTTGIARVAVGDVTVEQKSSNPDTFSDARGISISDLRGASTLSAGNMSVSGSTDSYGVSVGNYSDVSSRTIVTVGSASVIGVNTAQGIEAHVYNWGDVTVVSKGDVTAKANDSSDGEAFGVFAVHGEDALGEGESASSHGDITVFVDGTVSACGSKSYGIAHDTQGQSDGKLDVTVWRVNVGKDGLVAAKVIYVETPDDAAEFDPNVLDGHMPAHPEYVQDLALEAAINYIIRVDETVKGAVLSAAGTNGTTKQLDGKTYNVANKGERVYLTISDLQEGYRVLGAYSVLDGVKTALGFDNEKQQYYYIVPNGGGIFLTADVSNLYDVTFKNGEETLQSDKLAYGAMPVYSGATPTKAQTTECTYEFAGWKPVIDKVTGDVVYVANFTEKPREYTMTFDLDGGTVDGKSAYTIAAAYGSTITLPTPTREGYDFQYWEGSRYEGGASYKVEGLHAFKAVWKKKEEPAPAAESEPAPAEVKVDEAKANTPISSDSESTSVKTMPATGDMTPLLPVTVTLLISAAAFAVIRSMTRRGRNDR